MVNFEQGICEEFLKRFNENGKIDLSCLQKKINPLETRILIIRHRVEIYFILNYQI